jgi:hypothetical protein
MLQFSGPWAFWSSGSWAAGCVVRGAVWRVGPCIHRNWQKENLLSKMSNHDLPMNSCPTIEQAAQRFPYGNALGLSLHSSRPRLGGCAADEKPPSNRPGPPALISGRLNLSTKEVIHALGSPRMFQRMRAAKWIVPLDQSRDQIYPAAQILHAQQRLQDGERPPRLPSEVKQRAMAALN